MIGDYITTIPTLKRIRDGAFKRLRRKILHPYYREKCDFEDIVSYFKEESHALGFNKGYKHFTKYYTLWNEIRTRQPEYVLELGSGVTTLVILHALNQNGKGDLISIDESEYYGGVVDRLAHECMFPCRLSMNIIPAVHTSEGTHYEFIPDYPYDFVFVDGPQTDTIDLDAYHLLQKNPNIPILIDVRLPTVAFLQSKGYNARFSYIKNLGYVNL